MKKYSIGILLLLLSLVSNTAGAETISTSNPVTWNTSGQGSIAVQVASITGGGTITFYCTVDNTNFVAYNLTPSNGTTAVSTTTTNGIWTGPLGPCNQFKLTISAGTATVTQRTIQNVKYIPGSSGGGGGSGTVTSINTTSPITGGVITTTGTIACPTCLTGAGGSNTQIQFNNSGALAGSANLTWDGTSIILGGFYNITSPSQFDFEAISIGDTAAIDAVARSDGYAEGDFESRFIAAIGDVTPVSGDPTTPGAFVTMGVLATFYNDTTDETSIVAGYYITNSLTNAWVTGANGAVGIVQSAGGSVVAPTAMNSYLFVAGNGTGTSVQGVFQPSGGYKAADGTTGVTVTACTSFKNGLCVAGT